MRTHIILLILTIMLFAIACEDTVVNGRPGDDSFLFHLDVVDSSGDPRPGLSIGVWNELSLPHFVGQSESQGNALSEPPFVTTVTCLTPVACRANLTIFDLENNPVDTLLDENVYAGEWTVTWSGPEEPVANGVYKCIYSAYDSDSDALLYRDSIWMVLWQPDPAVSIIGYNDSDGSFETRDSLLFPNIFELPKIPQTGEDDWNVIDSFTVLDHVHITLTDTLTGTSQEFIETVIKGRNLIKLEWASPAIPSSHGGNVNTESDRLNLMPSDPQPPIPDEFELRQNYPNPFN
jgi:hypothetical protein